MMLLAYVTLCRPLLEYACEIWDPTTQFLITKLEDVQSKAIRYIKNLRERSVSITDSRVLLGLDTLQALRNNKRILLFHTILEHEPFFPGLLNILDQMRANHDFNTRLLALLSDEIFPTETLRRVEKRGNSDYRPVCKCSLVKFFPSFFS